MASSTHKVEVVPIQLEPHPNADSLSIVRIFGGGYTALVRTDEWQSRTKGAYIPPDSVVPDTPEYTFLDGKRRIKARKLRGIWSMGLLVPAPEGSEIGDDVAEKLGVTHYEPPEEFKMGGEQAAPPPGPLPTYDVESFRKYGKDVFGPNELVHVTEKIHGTNVRYMSDGEEMHVGSHEKWWKKSEGNVWWKTLEKYPQIEAFCRNYPHIALYGEVYGWVQELRYGARKGETKLALFDILCADGTWLNEREVRHFRDTFDLPWVPIIQDEMFFDFYRLLDYAEGNSFVVGADHMREGIVVKPMIERWDERCGRVCLKIVSNTYLEKSKK